MSLTRQNLVRWHGNGPITIDLTHPDTGATFSTTGYSLLMTVKSSVDDADADAIFQKSSGGGSMTVANPTVVTMASGDYTDVVRGQVYHFDVKAVSNSGGMPLTVAIGTIRFAHEITRETSPSVTEYTVNPSLVRFPISFLGAVTGLTGGGATKLDGQTTVGSTVPLLVALSINEDTQIWKLRTKSGEIEDAVAYVAPDDSSTLIWVRVL